MPTGGHILLFILLNAHALRQHPTSVRKPRTRVPDPEGLTPERLNRLGDKLRNELQKTVLLQHVRDDLLKRASEIFDKCAAAVHETRKLRESRQRKK